MTSLRTVRLGCIVASAAVLTAGAVVLGAMTPGYRPMADTVSRLGSAGQPYARWMQAVFVLYGLLVLVGAGPLGDAAPPRRRLLGVAVAGYALAAVVVGLAPKDPPDVPVTLASQMHVGATIVGGGLILLAMVLVATGAPRRVDRVLAGAVAIITAVSVVVFRFTWGASFYGLVERCILAPTAIWLAALAAATIVRERRTTISPPDRAPGGSG